MQTGKSGTLRLGPGGIPSTGGGNTLRRYSGRVCGGLETRMGRFWTFAGLNFLRKS